MNGMNRLERRFEDEKIIALRLSEQRKKYNRIETGIYVGQTLCMFSERLLFEGTLRVMVPENFVSLGEEEVRNKYPSQFRPQIILSNEVSTVNLTFSRFENTASWEILPDMMENFQKVIMNVNPSVLLLHRELYRIQNQPVPGMEFKSYAMDGAIYNFIFLFLADEKPVLGMFNSRYRDMQDWKFIFVKCLETLEDITIQEKR